MGRLHDSKPGSGNKGPRETVSNTTHLQKEGSRQDLGSVPPQTNTNQQMDESLACRRKREALLRRLLLLLPPPPTLEPSSKRNGSSTVCLESATRLPNYAVALRGTFARTQA